MDRLTAMQVFVAVTERGSVTAAAEALDMSRAMASRYLESLERWLGARLLHRTTRRIAMLPTYFVADDLRQGRLVPVMPAWEPEPLGIHAVYLSRRHQPLLLRAMIDFLAERLGGDVAPWDRDIAIDRSICTETT